MVHLDRDSTSSMARGSVRGTSEICADCNAPDPRWASLNRGVLVCDECCSIHRSLGRHISQIKSLKKGLWPSSQLQCVHQLNNTGANNIWEYALIDPTLNKQHKRKPNPRDQLHPTKADFIRAKYQFLTFTKKYKDEDIGTVKELSKQLHSSVRTSNLETSLRLLSLGADPNFLHPERGNRPIHVASQSGQSLQVELLVIYGADPGVLDYNGKTPADYARAENYPDIAHRLIESQYELTDTLANYLCSRKPDHSTGQHFIIPELADSVDVSELAKAARKKLQALTNHLFEELAADVYDEVDRRENEAIWVSTKANTTVNTRQSVPFLPVNPDFSATRNQGRQKLARFNAREFATLIIDILSDAKRRQTGASHLSNANMLDGAIRTIKVTSLSDDEPAYDTVASDEDYSSLGDANSVKEQPLPESQALTPTELNPNPGLNYTYTPDEMTSPTMSTAEKNGLAQSPPRDDLELRMALQQSKEKITELVSLNRKLQQETNVLQSQVKKLSKENSELKQVLQRSNVKQEKTISPPKTHDGKILTSQPEPTSNKPTNNTSVITMRLNGGRNRPHSMIDTRPKMSLLPVNMGSNLTTIQSGSLNRLHDKSDKSKSGGDIIAESENDNGSLYDNDNLLTVSLHHKLFPSYQSISEHTELITKQIQQLLIAAKSQQVDSFIPCSDKITQCVDDMIDLFPLELESDEIKSALSKLKSGAMQLCQEAKSPPPEINGQPDLRQKTHLLIQFAYDIAKAAKLLVTHVSRENE